MKFKLVLQEVHSPVIDIKKSFWLGKIKVYLNGKKLDKLNEKGNSYLIKMNDGSTRKILIKGNGFDYVPKVFIDGSEIKLAKNLLWYEYILGLMPTGLFLTGGALGGLFSALGILINFRILRMKYSIVIKIMLTLGVTVLVTLSHLGIAIIITALFL